MVPGAMPMKGPGDFFAEIANNGRGERLRVALSCGEPSMITIALLACLSASPCSQPPALTPAIPTIGMPSGYDQGNRKARRRDRKLGR